MLTDLTTELATAVAPALFGDMGTELCEIVRGVETPTGYGGVTITEAVPFTGIPCVYKPTPGSARYQLGREYLSGRIQMPCIFGSEPLALKSTDRIRILAGEGANYERLFAVKDISNVHGVYYDVGVTQEEGNA